MNNQEVINFLDQVRKILLDDKSWLESTTQPINEAFDMAISALEKQIPKKPTVPVDTWLCPSCGESVEYQQKLGDNVLYHGQHDFCPKCGQAIEWEENEE